MPEKVLVVESDSHTCMTIASILRHDGYEVVVAPDAITALTAARRELPHAVIVATRLPGGSGVQVIQRLRTNAATAITPVVALGGEHDRSIMIDAGAQAFVSGLTDAQGLLRALDEALGRRIEVAGPPVQVLNDPARIRAVRETGLLDAPPQDIFDRYTRLVAKLLNAPAAAFTLIDIDRQFLVSIAGLDLPPDTDRETPLSQSFCQWVVADGTLLSIADAREHSVLRTNGAIRDFGVVAYCGAPVTAGGGYALGALCAVDSRPHSWTAEDEAMLKDLATSLASELELRRLRRSA